MRDHTFFFMFHHRDFYGNMFVDDDGDQNPESSHGMMLFVDFEKYVTNRSQPIEMKLDEKFENYFDRIEKMVPISKYLFACILTSGKFLCIFFLLSLFYFIVSNYSTFFWQIWANHISILMGLC